MQKKSKIQLEKFFWTYVALKLYNMYRRKTYLARTNTQLAPMSVFSMNSKDSAHMRLTQEIAGEHGQNSTFSFTTCAFY